MDNASAAIAGVGRFGCDVLAAVSLGDGWGRCRANCKREGIGTSLVRCDAIQDIGLEVREDARVVERVVFCQLGSRILPMVSKNDDPIEGTVLEWMLRPGTSWPRS